MKNKIANVIFTKNELMRMEIVRLRELARDINEKTIWQNEEAKKWFEQKISDLKIQEAFNRAKRRA